MIPIQGSNPPSIQALNAAAPPARHEAGPYGDVMAFHAGQWPAEGELNTGHVPVRNTSPEAFYPNRNELMTQFTMDLAKDLLRKLA